VIVRLSVIVLLGNQFGLKNKGRQDQSILFVNGFFKTGFKNDLFVFVGL